MSQNEWRKKSQAASTAAVSIKIFSKALGPGNHPTLKANERMILMIPVCNSLPICSDKWKIPAQRLFLLNVHISDSVHSPFYIHVHVCSLGKNKLTVSLFFKYLCMINIDQEFFMHIAIAFSLIMGQDFFFNKHSHIGNFHHLKGKQLKAG